VVGAATSKALFSQMKIRPQHRLLGESTMLTEPTKNDFGGSGHSRVTTRRS
jgi:hypothetical protein